MSSLMDPEKHGFTWHDISYRLKSAFAVLLSLAVLAGGSWFVYQKASAAWSSLQQSDDYTGDGEKPVTVIIPAGARLTDIADILVENDVIKTAKVFDNVAMASSEASKLPAGKYLLRTKLPAAKALEMMLDKKNQVQIKVFLREGLTLKEQLAILTQPRSKTDKPGGTGFTLAEYQAALKNPKALGLPAWANGQVEGYLFPNTYNFSGERNAAEVLSTMIQTFNKVAEKTDLVAGSKAVKHTPAEVMIVASIIEAEVKRDEDRAKVARVVYNRLDQGMPLQLDTTVKYYSGRDGSTDTTAEARAKDHPYNTYKIKGLPPGPISTPGEKAITAALNPAEGDWLYFVVVNTKTGETAFAESKAGHDRNVRKYQQYCKENKNSC